MNSSKNKNLVKIKSFADGSKRGGLMGNRIVLPESYFPSDDEEFMNDKQLEFFRQELLIWRISLVEEASERVSAVCKAWMAVREGRVRHTKLYISFQSTTLTKSPHRRQPSSAFNDAASCLTGGLVAGARFQASPVSSRRYGTSFVGTAMPRM